MTLQRTISTGFIQTSDGKVLCSSQTVTNNHEGFEEHCAKISTFVFKPFQTSQFRETLSLRKTKTDKVDAKTIALISLRIPISMCILCKLIGTKNWGRSPAIVSTKLPNSPNSSNLFQDTSRFCSPNSKIQFQASIQVPFMPCYWNIRVPKMSPNRSCILW